MRYHCPHCRAYSETARRKGSGWIEFVLYLFYIVPGVIYSIWRRSGPPSLCTVCGKAGVIAADTGTHVRCPDCAELVLAEARKCRHCGCSLLPSGVR